MLLYYTYSYYFENNYIYNIKRNPIQVDTSLYQSYAAIDTGALKEILTDYQVGLINITQAQFEVVSLLYLERITKINLYQGFGVLAHLLFLDSKDNRLFIKRLLDNHFLNKPIDYTKSVILVILNALDCVYMPTLSNANTLIFFIKTLYGWIYKTIPSKSLIQLLIKTVHEKNFISWKDLLFSANKKTFNFFLGFMIALFVYVPFIAFPSEASPFSGSTNNLGKPSPTRTNVIRRAFNPSTRKQRVQVYLVRDNVYVGSVEKDFSESNNIQDSATITAKAQLSQPLLDNFVPREKSIPQAEVFYNLLQHVPHVENPHETSVVVVDINKNRVQALTVETTNQFQPRTEAERFESLNMDTHAILEEAMQNKALQKKFKLTKDELNSIHIDVLDGKVAQRAHVLPRHVAEFGKLRQASDDFSDTFLVDIWVHHLMDSLSVWDIPVSQLDNLTFFEILTNNAKSVVASLLSVDSSFTLKSAPTASRTARDLYLAMVSRRYEFCAAHEIQEIENFYSYIDSNELINYYIANRAVAKFQDLSKALETTVFREQGTESSLLKYKNNGAAYQETLAKQRQQINLFNKQTLNYRELNFFIERLLFALSEKAKDSGNPTALLEYLDSLATKVKNNHAALKDELKSLKAKIQNEAMLNLYTKQLNFLDNKLATNVFAQGQSALQNENVSPDQYFLKMLRNEAVFNLKINNFKQFSITFEGNTRGTRATSDLSNLCSHAASTSQENPQAIATRQVTSSSVGALQIADNFLTAAENAVGKEVASILVKDGLAHTGPIPSGLSTVSQTTGDLSPKIHGMSVKALRQMWRLDTSPTATASSLKASTTENDIGVGKSAYRALPSSVSVTTAPSSPTASSNKNSLSVREKARQTVKKARSRRASV